VTLLAILVGGFLVLLVLGVPVAVSMGVAATAAVLLATNLPLVVVGQRMLVILDSFPFLALPFFIFAGMLMERGGITQRLIDFAMIFVGRVTGGLAQVLVGANMIMSGASGAATADCAATGSVLIPAMAKAGYSRAFAAALTAAASTVGPIIPPSIMFVLYGAMTNVSIGKLFVGGILPGLIMGAYLMIAAYVISRRRRYPKLSGVPLRRAACVTAGALPAVLMPVIVLGGIIGGVFTPTEAGAIAAVYAFVLALFVYREMKLRDLLPIMASTASITAAVMLIVSAASLFGWLLARERVPDLLVAAATDWTANPIAFLLVVNVLFVVLGCFFEAVSLLILVTPIMMPLIAAYGIDPVHFGVLLTLNLTLGLLTPPVGMNMFIVCSIGKVTIREYTREIWPFLLALLLALAVVTYVPATVLFLADRLVY
jgi:tripartite ATP-independent transporter DctM subunit